MKYRFTCSTFCVLLLLAFGVGAQEGGSSPAPAPASRETSLADVLAQLETLRTEMGQLRGDIDSRLQEVVGRYQSENERLQFKVKQLEREKEFLRQDLEVENDLLRRHIRELYGTRGIQLPAVPTPDKNLIESILAEEPGEFAPPNPPLPQVDVEPAATVADDVEPAPEATTPATEPAPAPLPAAGPPYEIIDEWGRSPEEAASLGQGVSSLRGMIVVVPAGSDDAHVARVARELRSSLQAYDNINIEVFDDHDVALKYKADHVASPGHRVASVSRHAASNRDVILLIRGETATELPPEETPPDGADSP
jgi:TolA-binding protein